MNANNAVLVLDVDSQPLRIADWKTIVCDELLGKVIVIEYSRDRTIKGVTREYPFPSVVQVLTRFKRERQAIKFSRLNIYSRDAFTCQYCLQQMPSEDLTFDHVIPRSHGGKTSWDNIVTCCIDCNSSKADRKPHEVTVHWNGPVMTFCELDNTCPGCVQDLATGPLTLRRKPKKPWSLPVVTVDMGRSRVPAEWLPYWTGALEK
jgi:5-methylcytosine-specific restriction endonuclease McrA